MHFYRILRTWMLHISIYLRYLARPAAESLVAILLLVDQKRPSVTLIAHKVLLMHVPENNDGNSQFIKYFQSTRCLWACNDKTISQV